MRECRKTNWEKKPVGDGKAEMRPGVMFTMLFKELVRKPGVIDVRPLGSFHVFTKEEATEIDVLPLGSFTDS